MLAVRFRPAPLGSWSGPSVGLTGTTRPAAVGLLPSLAVEGPPSSSSPAPDGLDWEAPRRRRRSAAAEVAPLEAMRVEIMDQQPTHWRIVLPPQAGPRGGLQGRLPGMHCRVRASQKAGARGPRDGVGDGKTRRVFLNLRRALPTHMGFYKKRQIFFSRKDSGSPAHPLASYGLSGQQQEA